MLALTLAASAAISGQKQTRGILVAVVIFADLFYWTSAHNPLAYARSSFEDLYGKGEYLIGQKVKPTVPELTRFHGALQTATFGSLNHPLDVQLETTYGYNPLKLRSYDDYMQAAQSNPRLLNGLNVSRELDAGKGAVVDRAGLPRAYFARRSETATGKERLRDLDPADTVLVEGAAAMAHDPSASAQIPAYTGSHYGIRAKTASASYLTIAVPDFPGWVASMDGKAAPVLRANHALMAVLVPAGEHQLTLDYQRS